LADLIEIVDEKSKLREKIPFLAEVVVSQAQILLDKLPKVIQNSACERPLISIRNVGQEELHIYNIQFQHNQFRVVPEISNDLVLAPGQRTQLALAVQRKANWFLDTKLDDVLMLLCNDPKTPKLRVQTVVTSKVRHFIPWLWRGGTR
jgi:hypothetical protein